MMIRTNERMPTDGFHRLPSKRKGEGPGGPRSEESCGCIRSCRQTRSRYPAYVRANTTGRVRRAAATSPANQKKIAAGEGGGPLGIDKTRNGPTTSAHSRRARFRILRRTAGSILTHRANRTRAHDDLPRLGQAWLGYTAMTLGTPIVTTSSKGRLNPLCRIQLSGLDRSLGFGRLFASLNRR